MGSKKITIIGGGFAGTMVAVNCIQKAKGNLDIHIIDEHGLFAKGIAYSPYSNKQLLNVVASKMSAFANEPDHFLDWLVIQEKFIGVDRGLLAQSFLPRKIYGEYLNNIWETSIRNLPENIQLKQYHSVVKDIVLSEEEVVTILNNDLKIPADACILATGNTIPKNPVILNQSFYLSKKYFRDPWSSNSGEELKKDLPVLIIGNGLTMVDTVIGLLEKGFHNTIYSISPNGFNILPHRNTSIQYKSLLNEIPEKVNLNQIVKLVFKHIRLVRSFGITAEPVIDSLRPLTQKIWQEFSDEEKRKFLSRYRHLWGVARHRIPLHIYDMINKLKSEGKLKVISGKLLNIVEKENKAEVEFFNKKTKQTEKVNVQRVINCTGPDSDIKNMEDSFLKSCLEKGYITQDSLKLGADTDVKTFQTINSQGKKNKNILAIGSLLKGNLWETTAVNELRTQAANIADLLINEN